MGLLLCSLLKWAKQRLRYRKMKKCVHRGFKSISPIWFDPYLEVISVIFPRCITLWVCVLKWLSDDSLRVCAGQLNFHSKSLYWDSEPQCISSKIFTVFKSYNQAYNFMYSIFHWVLADKAGTVHSCFLILFVIQHLDAIEIFRL